MRTYVNALSTFQALTLHTSIYFATLIFGFVYFFYKWDPSIYASIIVPPFFTPVNFLVDQFSGLLDYKEFSEQQGWIFRLSPEDSSRLRTTMQKVNLLLFNKILSIHRSYCFSVFLCARFPISDIPVAWGDFRPHPTVRTDFDTKISRVQRSGKARWHPDKFLSRRKVHTLVRVARDENNKDAFYLVTRRFSNTIINQHNPQPTQSRMSSSEGEGFNMDVSGSESNYESEPTLKKVSRLSFWLIQRFSLLLFNRHPRKGRRCQNPSKAKRRIRRRQSFLPRRRRQHQKRIQRLFTRQQLSSDSHWH